MKSKMAVMLLVLVIVLSGALYGFAPFRENIQVDTTSTNAIAMDKKLPSLVYGTNLTEISEDKE